MVRSARLSNTRQSKSAFSASSTAGSTLSPEYPAPAPMRKTFFNLSHSSLGGERNLSEDYGRDQHHYAHQPRPRKHVAYVCADVHPGQPDEQEERGRQGRERETHSVHPD